MVGMGGRGRRGQSVAHAVALVTRGPCRAGASSQGPFLFPTARFWGASSDYRAAPHGREPPELTWGGEDEEGLLHPPRGRGSHGTNGPGCFFGLDGGGKKEEKTTRGAALLFGVTRRLRPSPARGLGAGEQPCRAQPQLAQGSHGAPQPSREHGDPTTTPGTSHIPSWSWLWGTSGGGEERPRDLWGCARSRCW